MQESAVEDYSDNVRQLGETARQLIADGHPESETIGVRIGQVRDSSRRYKSLIDFLMFNTFFFFFFLLFGEGEISPFVFGKF